MKILSCFSILLLFTVFSTAQNPDKIISLPLFTGELGNQYSGYITIDEAKGRKFHYWFVEAKQNPKTAPLVVWLNGGPGCSSMDGFFYENGPVKFVPGSSTVQLIENPYSWSNLANMLYVDSPAGVGFSYSTVGESDYKDQGDNSTADYNYMFLKLWFKQYPQYLTYDFWITGESYGGVYVPTFAKRVLDGILDKSFVIPFKGIMVGNGVSNSVGADEITVYIDFLFGHGLISRTLYQSIVSTCQKEPTSPQCKMLKKQAYDSMNGLDIYNIYADCYHQRPSDVPPCTDAYYSTIYLNMDDVKKAINVNPNVTWAICSGLVNQYYTRSQVSMVTYHKELVKNGLKVFIYSGDADFAVPYTDSEYWTSVEMGLTPRSDWRAWYFTDNEGQQVAGYVTEYDNLTFATIKGAGHMVPQYAPLPAYVMFKKVLQGVPL